MRMKKRLFDKADADALRMNEAKIDLLCACFWGRSELNYVGERLVVFGCRLATKLVEEDGRRPASQYGGLWGRLSNSSLIRLSMTK